MRLRLVMQLWGQCFSHLGYCASGASLYELILGSFGLCLETDTNLSLFSAHSLHPALCKFIQLLDLQPVSERAPSNW